MASLIIQHSTSIAAAIEEVEAAFLEAYGESPSKDKIASTALMAGLKSIKSLVTRAHVLRENAFGGGGQ